MTKVVHGPLNVGNQAWVLSQAERRHGVDSQVVVVSANWLGYSADRVLSAPGQSPWRGRLRRAVFGLTAPFRHDVMHLYFGQSYLQWRRLRGLRWLNNIDVRLARCLGRKLFMTLQGCDVRLSDASDAHNEFTMCRPGHCGLVNECRSQFDEDRRRLIRHLLPWFHRVFVVNPELARYVPDSTFLPYCSAEVAQIEPAYPRTDGSFVILHAPTDEGIKGSRFIIDAVRRLQARWPIELVVVKGMSHAEAMAHYRRADLVVDQVLAGWYGGLAVETMAMGKPVAAYIRAGDLGAVPPEMRAELPIVPVALATLERDLEDALARRREWPEWGRRSRAFVLRWHHPDWLARLMVEAYRDPESRFTLRPRESLAQAA